MNTSVEAQLTPTMAIVYRLLLIRAGQRLAPRQSPEAVDAELSEVIALVKALSQ